MTGQVSQGAIPQTDPSASYFAYQRPIDAAISRVLKSGSYILGGEAAAFETAFAQFISVAHAVGCANGTDAIELALRACNIGAGDLYDGSARTLANIKVTAPGATGCCSTCTPLRSIGRPLTDMRCRAGL